jgi:arginine N-succinyltransferase
MPAPLFLLREAQLKDVQDLIALSNTPGMFNMPNSEKAMKERIELSLRCFKGLEKTLSKTKYVFVAEDLKTHKVIATSMIAGQHGNEYAPHHFFKIGIERRFSPAIQTGFIHGTLTLKTQTNGPSELGALVVDARYRDLPSKVGKQIFFSRFLYLAKHPEKFKNEILAELLPPLNRKGNSPLWEAIGRRFTQLDYWEADRLSYQHKDFIFDLFPQGKIYTTFLSADARSSIGKVGAATEPVLHLLEKMGFTYRDEIDPFDGGPHLRASTKEIKPLRAVRRVELTALKTKPLTQGALQSGLITPARASPQFLGVVVSGILSVGQFQLAANQDLNKIQSLLKLKPTEEVLFIPYEGVL